MRGDFTRLTFKPEKGYSKVLMQQGRVQLDQDWNEQMEMMARQRQLLIHDMVGSSGAPSVNPGFALSFDQPTAGLLVSPGRFYVDGVQCEAASPDGQPFPINSQPFVVTEGGNEVFTLPEAGVPRSDLAYLKVWERHVSAVEDRELLDSALGGADTTTRSQTVWQVLTMPLPSDEAATSTAWDALTAPPTGALSTRASMPAPDSDPCHLPDEGGYRGVENRLYRVEVHQGGTRAEALFKWSRDNGSVAVRIEEISDRTVRVAHLGRDSYSRFAPGQWVEVINDRSELMDGAGTLTRIVAVNEAERLLTLEESVADQQGYNPRLVRWDMAGTAGALAMTGDWQDLELGVQVRFAEGTYRTGDYWAFAARAVNGSVESLTTAPRLGTVCHYYPLARVDTAWQTTDTGEQAPSVTVTDLRQIFHPMVFSRKDEVFVAGGSGFGARLQAAVNQLETGGRILIASGTHQLEQTVELRTTASIRIEGVPGATRLLYTSEDGSPALRALPGGEIHLSGIHLFGEGTDSLVAADTAGGLRLSRCLLVNLNPDGAVIWADQDAANLELDECILWGGGGIVGMNALSNIAIRRSIISQLHLFLFAKELENLSLSETSVDGISASDFAFGQDAIPALTPLSVPLIESGVKNHAFGAVSVPTGLFARTASGVSLERCNLRARLSGCLSGTAVHVRQSRADGLLVAFHVSEECSIEGSWMGELAAYGVAKRWRVRDCEASMLSFGGIGRDRYRLDTILQEGPIPSTRLIPTLQALLPPDVLDPAANTPVSGAEGSVNHVRIEENHLGHVIFREGTRSADLAITGNYFTGGEGALPAIWLRGYTYLPSHHIAHNLVETYTVGISTDIHGTIVTQNRITVSSSGLTSTVLDPVADILNQNTATAPIAIQMRSASHTNSANGSGVIREGEAVVSTVEDGSASPDLIATFEQVAAASTGVFLTVKEWIETFLQEHAAGQFMEAARALEEWLARTAALVDNAAIRLAQSQCKALDNWVHGPGSALPSPHGILLDRPTMAAGITLNEITVRGNRINEVRGYGIAVQEYYDNSAKHVASKNVRAEANELTQSGPIDFRGTEDLSVTGNALKLATTLSARVDAAVNVLHAHGVVHVTRNRIESGPTKALQVFDPNTSGAPLLYVIVTDNHFFGEAASMIYLGGEINTFSQNVIVHNPSSTRYAVQISGQTAVVIGNQWNETSRPLHVACTKYTAIGNTSNQTLLTATNSTQVQVVHNVK